MSKKQQGARAARRRRTRRQARPKPGQPVQVMGDTGACSCPVCLEQALSGEPRYTVDARGLLVELPPLPIPEIMEVTVRPRGPVSRFLPPVKTVRAGVGCIAGDLLGSLSHGDQAFAIAYPRLRGFVGGELCEPERVLLPGDEVVVEGIEDRKMSAFLREILVSYPIRP